MNRFQPNGMSLGTQEHPCSLSYSMRLTLKQVFVSSCSFLGLLLAFVRCLTFELDEAAGMASLHAFYMEGNVSHLLCKDALLILSLC